MLSTKDYNLLIIFKLQQFVRAKDNELIEFNDILKNYNINESDTSKQIYAKFCGERIRNVKKQSKNNGKKDKSNGSVRK